MYQTGSIPPPGPLSYEGQVVVPFISKTFAPETTFNQFPVPTVWINTAASTAYILVSKALGIAVWVPIGGSPGEIDTITTPDGTVVVPIAANINFLNGTGMNITGSSNNITFNSVGGGLTWSVVTSATQSMAIGHGYMANNGAGVTFSLPTTCAVGSVMAVTAMNAGGWTITQSAGQQIQLGRRNTTLGAGGSLASTNIGDTIFLVCSVADTNFIAIDMVGDITYV